MVKETSPVMQNKRGISVMFEEDVLHLFNILMLLPLYNHINFVHRSVISIHHPPDDILR